MSAKKMLHISDDLQLPLELVTLTQAILARKRSGKSYTGSVEAEELLEAKQQIAVIDPTSAWWGLRSSADGKGPGYSVVVFGGDHADAPLSYLSGKEMARAMVEHRFSAIFDIGSFETDEQLRFVMDFCSELLRINRTPLHVFMDEADTFAPQQGSKLQVKCRGTVSRLVKQGGIKGVGFTMITQRSASLSWDVLSQVDILTVLRMSAPHDLDPVRRWMQSETTREFAAQVYEEQPRLPVGTAFVASAPLQIAQRVTIRPRRTFNSGATPKPGENPAGPKVLAPIDLERLGKDIAASVQRAKEDSPEHLKRRIAELERAAAKAVVAPAAPVQQGMTDEERKAVEMLAEKLNELAGDVEKLERQTAGNVAVLNAVRGLAQQMLEALDGIDLDPIDTEVARDLRERVLEAKSKVSVLPAVQKRTEAPRPVAAARPVQVAVQASGPGEKMGKALRAVLNVLAQHGPSTKKKVAAITGYAVSGGGFGNALSEGRTRGWLRGSDPLEITDEGAQALGAVDPLPSGAELLATWLGRLGKAEREVLQYLAGNDDGAGVSKEILAEQTRYAANGGGFGNALSRLRTLELIEGSRQIALASEFREAIR